MKIRSKHTNCVSYYDGVINYGVSYLTSKDVLTNKEQLYESYWRSVKQQKVKAKIEKGVRLDPPPSPLPPLCLLGLRKLTTKVRDFCCCSLMWNTNISNFATNQATKLDKNYRFLLVHWVQKFEQVICRQNSRFIIAFILC